MDRFQLVRSYGPGVRKGDIQAERGLELGNEDDSGDYMRRAKGPSEIYPDGPQAE